MSNAGGWRNAPTPPQLRERIFDDEQCDLGDLSLVQSLPSFFQSLRVRVKDRAQITAQGRLQQLGAAIHILAKERFTLVQSPTHVGILGALPTEEEGDGTLVYFG